MYARNEKVVPVYIEEEVKDAYLNYAMRVIVGVPCLIYATV